MCEASRPTFRIHISGAHRGARKNHLFRPLTAFSFLFLACCRYSPYDLVQNFARDHLLSRGLRNLRAKILCEPHEKIPLRARSPPESSFFARALYDFARDCLGFARQGKIFARHCLISRDLGFVFARHCIPSRDTGYFFARNPATTALFFRIRLCLFSDFCC